MRIEKELEAMKRAAREQGLDESSVESIWLSEKGKADFERTNGHLLPANEAAGFEIVQHPI